MEPAPTMSATDRIAVVIAKILVFFRWPVVILGIASVVAAGYGAQYLGFSNNYRYFFAPENPQYKAFTELQNVYSKRDNLVFVLKPKGGTVFTRESLTAVRWLTDEGWKLPFVLRADSITNYQHTETQGDDLSVADLVKNPASLDPAGLERVKQIATNEPLLKDRIIAPDGHATGVVLTMVMPEKSPVEATVAMAAARKLVAEFRTRFPDVEIRLSGTVPLSNAFSEATQADITTLVPLMYLVVALTSLVLLRSWGAMFCVMIVLSMATVAAMGLAGWLHMTLTPPSALAPVIILTLAIAESVHVIHNFLHELRGGRTRFEAVIESTRVNFGAITLTSVTNAVGFLSLNAADAPPFRDLGNIVSLGVLTTWVYALLFLPALLAILPIGSRAKVVADEGGGFMRFLANFVITLRIPLAVSLTAATIWLGMQIPKIELNDQFVHWFDRSIEFRRDTDFLMEHLTGIYTVDYSIKSGESNGITNPGFLKKVEDFAIWARTQDHVLHVFTITDIMKRLNKNLNSDDPAFYKIPDDRQLAAQYLLLYELSLPLGLDLNDTINVDKSATRVIVTLKGPVSAVDTRAFKAKADAWIAANIPSSAGVEGASPAIMFSFIAQRNIDANLFGTGWAMIAISFLLIVPFRSLRLGLISLIPNLVPIIMTFGVWYFLVGRLGMASSIVTATSLGIVVDSTIHLLSKYIRGRRELGLSPEDSVRYSFSTVGPALWILTAALILGFLVLSLSPFEVNRSMGLLTAICIAFAIVADFFLLPPLLMFVDRRLKTVSQPPSLLQPNEDLTMKRTFAAALLALALPTLAHAETPEQKGLAIAVESQKRNEGWVDSRVEAKMILENKQGEKSERNMRLRALEVISDTDGDKSLTYFLSPADVQGTALLSFTHFKTPDDQWLYLPALKRVKRIASANKSGSFVGSEFAFEDLLAQEVQRFTYKYLRDEPCPTDEAKGLQCFVSERFPAYENSGYTRQVSWVDKKDYQVRKLEFYDRKAEQSKTLMFTGYKQYAGKFWRAHTLAMENHQTGKKTTLSFGAFELNAKVDKTEFDPDALGRLR